MGGGAERTNLEVVETICTALDERFPAKAPHSDLISFVCDRPGHDFRYAIDYTKIEKELGWRPRRAFGDGIIETVDWYLNNEPWWRDILTSTGGGKRLGLTEETAFSKGNGGRS